MAAYRATADSTTQTPEQRVAEARQILFAMGLTDVREMSKAEADFVNRFGGEIDIGVVPSPKQLWWLRDLKDKYLL
jgi:hypothetical protein